MAAQTFQTGAAGDAPIHQVWIISFQLCYVTHFAINVLGLYICNVVADVVLTMSLPQGGHNMCAAVCTVHTVDEPITVGSNDTSATDHGTGTPHYSGTLLSLPHAFPHHGVPLSHS